MKIAFLHLMQIYHYGIKWIEGMLQKFPNSFHLKQIWE